MTADFVRRIAVFGEPPMDIPASAGNVVGYADVNAIPADCKYVVMSRESMTDDAASAIRERCAEAKLVVWFGDRADEDAATAALEAGADGIIFGAVQFAAIVRSWLVALVKYDEREADLREYEGLRDLVEEVTAHPELQDVLRTAILRMSKLFDLEAVSVVLYQPEDEYGFVVVRRGDDLENLVIRIADYPELQKICETHDALLIPDVHDDALLLPVQDKIRAAEVAFTSSMLFPLMREGQIVGAVSLRSQRVLTKVSDRLLRMGRLIASVTSVAIGNALETDALLREQRDLLRDKADVDQLLEELKPFEEFFERSYDGIIVTEPDGRIRYVNKAAAAILGREPEDMRGSGFIELLSPHYHRLAGRAIEGKAIGDNHGYIDLLAPVGDEAVVMSASFRLVSRPGGVLITFRNVTEVREIENELRQTKEFLENMIQSSVDAIVAAETDGLIILFNRAAENMLGFSAHDIVGKVNVADLYHEGEAKDVMRRLRSDAYGGRGRLETARKELVACDGDGVPVNLSAAIIYEGEREIASVGIFTDLRERMKMEDKIARVEQQLRYSERQAVAMELAGAAAHELNQPLTSILGYAELLKRRMPDDEKFNKPVDVICRETERMAAIVRRIGQITDYRSKEYVGGATILDLTHGDDDTPARSSERKEDD